MRTHLLMGIAAICAMAGLLSMSAAHAMGTRPQSGRDLGTGQIVATAGIRGLDEEKLRTAQFDAAQVSQLESLAISADAARSFAAQGGLSSRPVAYLPDPAKRNGTHP